MQTCKLLIFEKLLAMLLCMLNYSTDFEGHLYTLSVGSYLTCCLFLTSVLYNVCHKIQNLGTVM